MEASKAIGLLGAIGSQNEFEECPFACFKPAVFADLREVGVYSDIVLALILAEVEDFECPIVFASRFEFTLNANHTLAGSVNCKLAEI